MSKRRLTQAEVGELVSLEQELAALKMEHGVRDRQGPIERLLAGYYAFKDSHIKKNPVRRRTYLWLCLLSVFGIHQFYARHPVRGLIYLALFVGPDCRWLLAWWTGWKPCPSRRTKKAVFWSSAGSSPAMAKNPSSRRQRMI